MRLESSAPFSITRLTIIVLIDSNTVISWSVTHRQDSYKRQHIKFENFESFLGQFREHFHHIISMVTFWGTQTVRDDLHSGRDTGIARSPLRSLIGDRNNEIQLNFTPPPFNNTIFILSTAPFQHHRCSWRCKV